MIFTKKKIDIPDPIQILVDMVCNRIVMEPSRVTASNGTSGYTIKDVVVTSSKIEVFIICDGSYIKINNEQKDKIRRSFKMAKDLNERIQSFEKSQENEKNAAQAVEELSRKMICQS